jgi:tetratricopeptide (TPR) repeat protein
MAAGCHSWRKLSRWATDPERETAEGTRLARRAVELGQHDAVALAASAHVLTHLNRDIESSVELLDRALVLDPNLAAGWYLGGFIRIWRGELDDAIEWIARGMRLSPLGPDIHRMEVGTAMAHLLRGRIGDALSWAERAVIQRSDHALPISIFAAIYARAGRVPKARLAIQQLRQLDPELRLSRLPEWLPFQRPEDLANFTDALREAGLPE